MPRFARDEGSLDYARVDSVEDRDDSVGGRGYSVGGRGYIKESRDDSKEEGRIEAVSMRMMVSVLRRLKFGIVSTRRADIMLRRLKYRVARTKWEVSVLRIV